MNKDDLENIKQATKEASELSGQPEAVFAGLRPGYLCAIVNKMKAGVKFEDFKTITAPEWERYRLCGKGFIKLLAMKGWVDLGENGLSMYERNVLSNANIPLNRDRIRELITSGELFQKVGKVRHLGFKTYRSICRWAGCYCGEKPVTKQFACPHCGGIIQKQNLKPL